MSDVEKVVKSAGSELSKLHKQTPQYKVGKETERTAGRIKDTIIPEIPEPEKEDVIAIADPNTAKIEAKKRRARANRGGRSSTILTEGLGG
jgi:hypothetical protein